MLFTLLETNISLPKCTFEDDFPFPRVGYVSALEGNCFVLVVLELDPKI